jgi:hypothetical protein
MTKIIRTKLMPANTGMAFIPGVIFIGEWVQEPLIKHELHHVKQQARDGYLSWLLSYVFSPSARLEYEAEAYAVSVYFHAHGGSDVDALIENQASNLLEYNAWMFWKPSMDTAISRIKHYYPLIQKEYSA